YWPAEVAMALAIERTTQRDHMAMLQRRGVRETPCHAQNCPQAAVAPAGKQHPRRRGKVAPALRYAGPRAEGLEDQYSGVGIKCRPARRMPATRVCTCLRPEAKARDWPPRCMPTRTNEAG